jgi:hypothetical protein
VSGISMMKAINQAREQEDTMNNNDPLLKVRAAVGAGRIPLAHLRSFIDSLEKALIRTGRVLLGDSTSLHRRAQPHKR